MKKKQKKKSKQKRAGERDTLYSPIVREIACNGFKSSSEFWTGRLIAMLAFWLSSRENTFLHSGKASKNCLLKNSQKFPKKSTYGSVMILLNFYAHLPQIPPLPITPFWARKWAEGLQLQYTGWAHTTGVTYINFPSLCPWHSWMVKQLENHSVHHALQTGYVSTDTASTTACQWKKLCIHY